MVSPEEYEGLKKTKSDYDEEPKKALTGPDDVKLKLFYDDHARREAKQKNKVEAQLNKIQPLLALHSANIEEVVKKIPADKQAEAIL